MLSAAIQAAWRSDAVVNNVILHVASPFSAEIMARAGYDSVTIDVQHGMIEVSDALAMLPGIEAAGVMPFARVSWNDPAAIMKLLDAGVLGIICPMVNDRAQAERFVGACRYAPRGYRSAGPTRAALVYGADYMAHADVGVIALAMIETRDALDQLETILDVDGLDGVYVGPNDLSLSLRGRGGIDHTDEDMLEVLRQIAQAARARGKVAGIFTGTPAYAQQMADLGYRFLTVSSDSRLLRDAAAASLAALRASDAPSSAVNVTPQSGY